jgi:hypothetical protein
MYLGLWLLSARHVSTLLHPHYTPGPSPYIYKRKVQGSRTRRWPRGRTGWRTVSLSLSLSPSRTLVTPYCKCIRPGHRTTRRSRFPLAVFPLLCYVSHRPIWAGTRSDNLLVGPGTPRDRNADTYTVKHKTASFCFFRSLVFRAEATAYVMMMMILCMSK